MKAPAALRMSQLLQRLFNQQARELMSKMSLRNITDATVPDMTPWVHTIATATKPILLDQARLGATQTAARIGAKLNARQGVTQLSDDIRRYAPGNDAIFGKSKALRLYRSMNRVVVKAPGKERPVIDFDTFNPKVLDSVDQAAFAFCRETMDTATTDLQTALKELRKLLKEGLSQGEVVALLAKKIRKIFADPNRAYLIAQTEVSRATHEGQILAAEASGLVQYKVWLASVDACPFCLELDGKRAKLREPYATLTTGNLAYRVIYCPPAHPRCYCSQTEEI